jgi:hypothetical protein
MRVSTASWGCDLAMQDLVDKLCDRQVDAVFAG